MRAASYARRSDSKGKKHDERSVEEQDALNLRAAQSNHWDLPPTRMYRDNDLSASRYSTKERPDWLALEKELNSGQLDVLLIWETSRAWRKLSEWVLLVDTCRDNKVLIHVTSHGRTYDPTQRRDRKTLIEEGVDSEDETEKTSERVKRAMEANRQQGRPHSRPPYGYAIEVDPTNHRAKIRVPVPELAPIVHEIIRRVARSEPVSAIAKDLNLRGIDSPSVAQGLKPHPRSQGKPQWSPAMVRKICTNEAYIGKRGLVDATWPPIVEDEGFEELFWKANNLIKDPERKTTKPGRAKYLLAFLGRCGVCNEYLTRMGGREGPDRYKCYAATGCVTIRMDWVDAAIGEAICNRLAKGDVLEQLTTRDNKDLYAELEELRADHQTALDLRSRKKLSLLALSQEEERILPRIEEIEKALRPVTLPQCIEDLTKDAQGNLQIIRTRWNRLDIPAKKDVVRTLIESIRILKTTVPGQHKTDEQIDNMLKARVKVKWVNEQ
ncbi:recombinase family protein [Streptosporangium jomthongense]|uniref:Recombinase family protein n=1 Tax=Streptosporangium jomthongense TaxID=1193683 RepID=A0ABV8F391_9ACTN